jgi:hypothetical protein
MNKARFVMMRGIAALAVMSLLVTMTIAVTSPKDAFAPRGLRGAPVAITGENVYVAWFTNNTANNNEEVMFRASTDGGVTFADKINLSNTTDVQSEDVEIAAEGENVIVTWWERNATSDTPVMRVSANGGDTFGPTLRLAANGTIGVEEEEEEEGGEAVEAVEEAVGGAQVAQ